MKRSRLPTASAGAAAPCVSKRTGRPLAAHWSQELARAEARRLNQAKQLDLEAYRCPQCDYWHLRTARHYCSCTCSYGQPKRWYATEQQAQAIACDRGMATYLTTYPCPEGDGYHLTSR